MNKKKAYLALSGIILILVGGYINLSPDGYLNLFDLSLTGHISFYSDLRSMGGSLLIFGLLALAGTFIKTVEDAALMTSSIIFGSYTIFRITAAIMDGLPDTNIMVAAAVEIIFTILGFTLIIRNQKLKGTWFPFRSHASR